MIRDINNKEREDKEHFIPLAFKDERFQRKMTFHIHNRNFKSSSKFQFLSSPNPNCGTQTRMRRAEVISFEPNPVVVGLQYFALLYLSLNYFVLLMKDFLNPE